MNILNKIGIKGSLQRNFGAIVILALDRFCYIWASFFRFEYYDAYLSTYHLTNTQMGVFGTVIGVFGIVSYLFGRSCCRWNVCEENYCIFTTIVTGIGGLYICCRLDSKDCLQSMHCGGVSTTFAFWPACVKAVRVLSDEDSQGKAYGFF